MSTILKALRRLEEEQRREAADLHEAVVAAPPPEPRRLRWPLWTGVLGGLALAGLLYAGASRPWRAEAGAEVAAASPPAFDASVSAVSAPPAPMASAPARPVAMPPPSERSAAAAPPATRPAPVAVAEEPEVAWVERAAPAEEPEVAWVERAAPAGRAAPAPRQLAQADPGEAKLPDPVRTRAGGEPRSAPSRRASTSGQGDAPAPPPAPWDEPVAPSSAEAAGPPGERAGVEAEAVSDEASPVAGGAEKERVIPSPAPARADRVGATPTREPRASDAPAPVEVAPATGERGDVPVIHRARVPAVSVVGTTWHPRRARRSAQVRIDGGEPVELREGEMAGAPVVREIRPSAVVFAHDGVEITRRVGAE